MVPWHLGISGYDGWRAIHVFLEYCKRKEVGTIEQINVTPIKISVLSRKTHSFLDLGVVIFSIGLFFFFWGFADLVWNSASGKQYPYCMAVSGDIPRSLLRLGIAKISTTAIHRAGNVGLPFSSWWFSLLMKRAIHPIDRMPELGTSGRLLPILLPIL